jgi:carboxymethylenebutenolidase
VGQEIRLGAADGGTFAAYLALPSQPRAPGVVVLPEVFNTNPHIRSVADGYAAAGYVALAPDINETAAAQARDRTLAHFRRLLA